MDTTYLLKLELTRIQSLLQMMPIVQKPEGHLEPRGKRNNPNYRIVQYVDGQRCTRNIGNNHSPEFRNYVRDLFLFTRRRILEKDEKLLKNLLDKFHPYDIQSMITDMPKPVRKLYKWGFVDERYEELKRWAAEPVPSNTAEFDENATHAADGTLVRSKGEAIIYDLLQMLGIPFRYDKAFTVIDDFGNEKIIYPDFQIKCRDGSIVIIEHLGGLEKVNYCNRLASNLRYYLRKKYVIGKNLFITSDNEGHGTETDYIMDTLYIVEQRFWYGVIDNSEVLG